MRSRRVWVCHMAVRILESPYFFTPTQRSDAQFWMHLIFGLFGVMLHLGFTITKNHETPTPDSQLERQSVSQSVTVLINHSRKSKATRYLACLSALTNRRPQQTTGWTSHLPAVDPAFNLSHTSCTIDCTYSPYRPTPSLSLSLSFSRARALSCQGILRVSVICLWVTSGHSVPKSVPRNLGL
jgi:hypothetical protein